MARSKPPRSIVRKFDDVGGFNWQVWAAMSAWSIEEALCVFSPENSILLQLKSRPIGDLIRTHIDPGMRDVFNRAVEAGEVRNPDSPARWIKLAQRFKIEVPSGLINITTDRVTPRLRARATEHAIDKWYIQRKKDGAVSNEAADWDAARVQFGDRVTREQIRAVRRKMLPPAQRKQGPRRSTPR